MANINTEIRNPYYSGHIFSLEEEEGLNILAITIHARLKDYETVDLSKEEPKWSYEWIADGTNEPCYQFKLYQGNTCIMAVYIPIGIFYRHSVYVPFTQDLSEDNPAVPVLMDYLKGIKQQLIKQAPSPIF